MTRDGKTALSLMQQRLRSGADTAGVAGKFVLLSRMLGEGGSSTESILPDGYAIRP